jgi:hypothetical protein
MAKRVTIRSNPLDTLVPDAMKRQIRESPLATGVQSVIPARSTIRSAATRNRSKAGDNHVSSFATPVAPPPVSTDLVSRIQSLEKENEYIKWLVIGAILFVVLI